MTELDPIYASKIVTAIVGFVWSAENINSDESGRRLHCCTAVAYLCALRALISFQKIGFVAEFIYSS